MKVNEAPYKLYCCNKGNCNIFVDYRPFPNDDNVEYIRADAFMKKAENFLEMLGYGFTITDNITHANYDKEQLIEDFRKYMEGVSYDSKLYLSKHN